MTKQREGGEVQLAVLRQVTTRVEADLIQALLRGEAIVSEAFPPPAHDGFWWGGWHGAPPEGTITIRVRAEDLERAREVIAEQGFPEEQ